MTPQFQVEAPKFTRLMHEYSAVFKKERDDVFKMQGRLLVQELIARTPPLAGKTLGKILEARGQSFRDPAVGSLPARNVGALAIARDMRKMFTPVYNFGLSVMRRTKNSARSAFVFLYKRADGLLAGVEDGLYNPNPTTDWMNAVREPVRRTKRGKVDWPHRGAREGRIWFNLKKYPVPAEMLQSAIDEATKRVGRAKKGWCPAFKLLGGGKVTGWIGNQPEQGVATVNFSDGKILIEMANRSRWAEGGDPDGVVLSSIARRERAMENQIRKALEKSFGKGAGASYK